MFCRKCGKTVPDDSKFCPYCGEAVTVGEEAPKEHGFCKNCGNPLPAGKLFGLCDDCLSRSGIETAEYGRCENCGKPLEPDDGTLCKECAQKAVTAHLPSGSYPYGVCARCGNPLESDEQFICSNCQQETAKVDSQSYAYGTRYEDFNRPKRHGGAVVAILAVVIIAFVGTYYSRLDSPASAASSGAVSSATYSAPDAAAEPPTTPAAAEPEVKPDLELISSDGTFDTDIDAIHITGSIKNNSDKTYTYAQVQFTLYDKSGAQVGTALANITSLEPGKTWKYDAIGMAHGVDTFRLIDLSGY